MIRLDYPYIKINGIMRGCIVKINEVNLPPIGVVKDLYLGEESPMSKIYIPYVVIKWKRREAHIPLERCGLVKERS